MHSNEHYELLNPRNGLVACPITATTPTSLVEGGLALTASLFPHEPDARDRLKAVYQALSQNNGRAGDFEAIHYYTYAIPRNGTLEVIGIAGLYRLLELDEEGVAIAATVRSFLARSLIEEGTLVEPRVSSESLLLDLVWGGRMGISPAFSRSPGVAPFIYHHILSSAISTIARLALPPVMLLFTRRDDNDPLLKLYEGMGFMKTGAELSYLDHDQAVLALHLHKGTPIVRAMMALKQRALRRAH
jgi:hypothetical protein